MIVVDTSLALQWVLDEPDGGRTEQLGGKLATRDVPFQKRLSDRGLGLLLEGAP